VTGGFERVRPVLPEMPADLPDSYLPERLIEVQIELARMPAIVVMETVVNAAVSVAARSDTLTPRDVLQKALATAISDESWRERVRDEVKKVTGL
jgi:hypothetical protein